ncbi:MAG: hypothetical protein P1P84_07135 [Deferrisomatales bacterium]|nr:hypothetical protein [Deferrisomatales bacterium]
MMNPKVVFLPLLVGLVAGISEKALGGTLELASVNSQWRQANDDSWDPAISRDGRFVVFQSRADNLVPADTNGTWDVFIRDRVDGITYRASVDSDGNEGNGESYWPSVSGHGRFVSFTSWADNLVDNDTNEFPDVFVHDIENRTTVRVSLDSAGVEGNGGSFQSVVSADGQLVAFVSVASNLVAGDENGFADVFVHDRQSGETQRVSVDPAGLDAIGDSGSPAISANGGFVVYSSSAPNLVEGDSNDVSDVYVTDLSSGVTVRVSVASDGAEGDDSSRQPAISGDGRFVSFTSSAGNLVGGDRNGVSDVYVHDRWSGTTSRVSIDSAGAEGNDSSVESSISSDGRIVAFRSRAANLVTNDTNGERDVFIRDRAFGTTCRVSVSAAGEEGNDTSWLPSVSGDGGHVAFEAVASNLIPNDGNGVPDILVAVADCPPVGETIVEVPIDVKPGSEVNPINLASRGVVPVAVLTTGAFDGTTVDPSSVRLAGGLARHSSLEDVDRDGDLDLLLQIPARELSILPGSETIVLVGETYNGLAIVGWDSITLVPRGEERRASRTR